VTKEQLPEVKSKTKQFSFLDKIKKLTDELETKRGTVIIPLLFTRPISRPLVSDIYDFLLSKKGLESCEILEVVLHSSGGDIDAAYHLGKILRGYASKQLKVIVPRFAKSAATLLACAGHVIVMEKPSELGSLEPVIEMSSGETFSPLSVDKLIEFLDNVERRLARTSRIVEIIAKRIPIMTMGDCLKTTTYAEPYLRELLTTGMFRDDPERNKKADEICKRFIYEYPTKGHGYIIDVEEAERIGLKIERPKKDEWEIIWKIFRIFEKEVLL
jgi:hypothetical protein